MDKSKKLILVGSIINILGAILSFVLLKNVTVGIVLIVTAVISYLLASTSYLGVCYILTIILSLPQMFYLSGIFYLLGASVIHKNKDDYERPSFNINFHISWGKIGKLFSFSYLIITIFLLVALFFTIGNCIVNIDYEFNFGKIIAIWFIFGGITSLLRLIFEIACKKKHNIKELLGQLIYAIVFPIGGLLWLVGATYAYARNVISDGEYAKTHRVSSRSSSSSSSVINNNDSDDSPKEIDYSMQRDIERALNSVVSYYTLENTVSSNMTEIQIRFYLMFSYGKNSINITIREEHSNFEGTYDDVKQVRNLIVSGYKNINYELNSKAKWALRNINLPAGTRISIRCE